MDQQDKFRGCLLGLAAGDAVGTTVEFKRRGFFEPLTDMVGGGPFNLQAGQWTDDTSMALCLATSLLIQRKFDAQDQMQRYCQWANEGYLSSTGSCFDIGNTVSASLRKFQQTGEPFAGSVEPNTAGNGSLMRLAPIPLFYFPDLKNCESFAGLSSRTTHAASECVDACRLFSRILFRALEGQTKEEILFADADTFAGANKIVDIAQGNYCSKTEAEIKGTGYVVDALEAALWCFWNSSTFEEAILKAANLGDDADTTAAICGQIAGAHYGSAGIPLHWLEKLTLQKEITQLADQLYNFPDK